MRTFRLLAAEMQSSTAGPEQSTTQRSVLAKSTAFKRNVQLFLKREGSLKFFSDKNESIIIL